MIEPSIGHLVVKPIEADEEVTEAGIVLPETTSKATEAQQGEVVAVSHGYFEHGQLIATTYKVGDRLLYSRQYVGTDIEIDREPFKLLRFSDVLARVLPQESE